jgi:hypothetical protein
MEAAARMRTPSINTRTLAALAGHFFGVELSKKRVSGGILASFDRGTRIFLRGQTLSVQTNTEHAL